MRLDIRKIGVVKNGDSDLGAFAPARVYHGNMRFWLVAVAVALGAVTAGRAARACSCVEPSLERTLVPPSGTTGFPTNGRIRVLLRAFPEKLRAKLAVEYRLKDDQGALVPLEGKVDGTLLTLVPKAPLRPKTRYTLERLHAFATDGRRLDDAERWRAAKKHEVGTPLISRWHEEALGTPAVRRWYEDAWLVTGEGVEARLPPAPPPIEVKIEFRHGGGDCGPGTNIYASFAYKDAAFAPTEVVALERWGHGILGHFLPGNSREAPGRILYAGNTMCVSDAADIDPEGVFELRLLTLSAAGATVPATRWTTVDPKETRPPATAARLPAWTSTSVARWSSPPISEPKRDEGFSVPKACPFGLESRGHSELGGPVPWRYGEQLSLGWTDGDIRTIGLDEQARSGRIIRWSMGTLAPSLALPGPVDWVRGLFRADAALVAIVGYGRDFDTGIKTIMTDNDGKVRWTQSLGQNGINKEPFLAWGPHHALVCWRHAPHKTLDDPRVLLCTVLDATSGKVVRPAAPLPIAPGNARKVQPGGGHAAAVATEQGFAIAWTSSYRPSARQAWHEAYLTLLTDAGAPVATRTIGGEEVRALALERVGDELAVAWDGKNGIEVTWLGLDGKSHRAPYVVAGGPYAHSPRLAQRQGLLAIAWGEGPGHRGFVAVTDPSGAVSPRLEIGAGLDPPAPALAPTAYGFAAAYNVSYGRTSFLEPLVCRAGSPGGPPDRIVLPPAKR